MKLARNRKIRTDSRLRLHGSDGLAMTSFSHPNINASYGPFSSTAAAIRKPTFEILNTSCICSQCPERYCSRWTSST